MIIPVILSGGSGTRLWPLSTDSRPKQFLPLVGSASLFADTLARVADPARFAPPIIVGNRAHALLMAEALGSRQRDATLIFEPAPRNTAPAIALAAHAAIARDGADAMLLVMPSDHIMADVPAFLAAVETARASADAGWLVTFGIRPTTAETGFGYLEPGADIDIAPGVHAVRRFVEKPPLADAQAMVAGGKCLWNAGIFLMRADVLLRELAGHSADIALACHRAMLSATRDGTALLPASAAFAACPSQSIDYAVMERAQQVAVVPVDPGWSDVGSWDAIAAMGEADGAGNRISGDVTIVDVSNCLIRSDGVDIAALGIHDLIIVVSDGKMLIMPRGRSQEVKRLLAARIP